MRKLLIAAVLISIFLLFVTSQSFAECAGDLNNDGNVDESDLALLAPDFGHIDCDQADGCVGDLNDDNDVDGSDLAQLAKEFGRTDCPLIQITMHPAVDGAPAWSPDDSKIAFSST